MTTTADLDVLRTRLARATTAAEGDGIDALVLSPGPDLRYLVGYDAIALERLTALVLRPGHEPVLVVPVLERPAALASPVGDLDLDVLTWGDREDPYALVADLLQGVATVGLDDLMHAVKVLNLRAAMPAAIQVAAGVTLRELRMRKSPSEIQALQEAGAAIDSVHARVPEWLRAGRTEREVGKDIADAIMASGHDRVDFVIVASGPNAASPHHELSDRVIGVGEPVVVDIGGTMPSGYCSDSTRTYCVGEPPAEFRAYYEVLQRAQLEAVEAVRPGLTCAALDAVARDVIDDAGYGDFFLHRTGHGIGIETHEEPYIVGGNDLPLEPGMAFSVEPGIYLDGRHGARIEDIVVCGEAGPILCNTRPRHLVVVAS